MTKVPEADLTGRQASPDRLRPSAAPVPGRVRELANRLASLTINYAHGEGAVDQRQSHGAQALDRACDRLASTNRRKADED